MKHGLIVLAHGDIPDLLDMLDQFGPEFRAYIHLDRKANVSKAQIEALRATPGVSFVSRRYTVNWGGLNIVRAIIHLAQEATKDRELAYLHMVTGTDRIIVKPSEFLAFFEAHNGQEFMLHFPLPTSIWQHGGLDRLAYYDPLDLFNVRTQNGKRCRNLLLHFQQRLGLKRRIPKRFPPLFGGSMSWSLTGALMRNVIATLERDASYLRRFANTFCPDEIALQTLIMNSSFAPRVVNRNLRYIDWSRKRSPHPYVLDLKNWEAMRASGDLLARKIVRPISDELIERLRDHVREDRSAT